MIVVILESFRAADVGSLGGTPGVTPEFDRLAADGVLFERAYCVGTQTARAYLAIECSLLPLFGERLTRRADLPGSSPSATSSRRPATERPSSTAPRASSTDSASSSSPRARTR